MRYSRPVKREPSEKTFSVGTHAATIKKVSNKKAKSGSNMFMLSIEGQNEEKGMFFLVFGNDYTEENMNYLLSSIEDNGVDIPDLEFGWNKATFAFLENKEVYINVELREYKGEMKPTITTFLTLAEFEGSEEFDETEEDPDGFN